MYLKNEHIKEVLRENDINPDEFDKFERLSSKAGLFSTGSRVLIVYVNTIVFKRNKDIIMLNTDGWKTMTSKNWINYGFDSFARDRLRLYQEKYIWYVQQNDDKPVEYKDNMIIQLDN